MENDQKNRPGDQVSIFKTMYAAFSEFFRSMELRFVIVLAFVLGGHIRVSSQNATVDVIKNFYIEVDIDSYKDRIQRGMDAFDRWLVDTLYQKSSIGIWFCPADIRLDDYAIKHVVTLRPYNMKSFNSDDNIYDHLIIDSALCVSLISINKRMQPVGITDVEGQPYSFCSFDKKKECTHNLFYSKELNRLINKLIKFAHRYNAEALVRIMNLPISEYYGYIKEGHIYLVGRKCKKPLELQDFIKHIIESNMDELQTSDMLLLPTYKEYWESDTTGYYHYRQTGNTPKSEIRLCHVP